MTKLIKISEHKAFKIQPVLIKGEKYFSIRQMYSTKNDSEWKHGKAGIILAYEELRKLFKRAKTMHEDSDTEYEDIFGDMEKSKEPKAKSKKVKK